MKKKICLIFYLVTISFLFAESLSGFMNIPFGIDKKEFKENLLKKNIAIELESNDWINCELNFKFLGHDGCSFCAYFENERFSSFVLEMLDYKDDASFSQIRKIATDIASTIGITFYESDLDGILL